ncbi:MAG: LytR C-terminal domain-containing protein, partial [Brachybacterium sp.]|nr:LytR C-terminal domain-containing protein [Brachybacterium sp.]
MSPGRTEHPYGRSAEQMRRRTDRERRLRRVRATQLIVFSILVIGLFVAAWYAWTQLREASSPAPSSTTAEETTPEGPWCPEEGAVPADPSEVEVSVLNGTSTTGLAGSVSGELVERGFVAGEVGNTG